jgi:hypothetical protein
MSASSFTFICPISGKRKVVAGASGVEVEVGKVDPLSPLPVGWGRIIIETIVPNPDVAERAAAREREKAEGLAQIQAMCEDKEVPASVRNSTKKKLASGDVAREIDLRISLDPRFADPAEPVQVVRTVFAVLSDEALAAARGALKEAGFPIEVA